jgi:O-antigen/teichoic acid export membrane protein
MLGNMAQQGLAFATVLIVARLLQPDEFAVVRVALAYVAVATVVASGGLTAPILRYCADNRFDDMARRILLGVGLRRMIGVALVTLVVLLALIAVRQAGGVESSVFTMYAFQLPGLAAVSILLVYLQAIQEFKLMSAYQVVIRMLALMVTGAATYGFGLNGLLMSSLLVAYLGCVPLILMARPVFRPDKAVGIPADFSHLAAFGATGTLITAVGQYSDMILLDIVQVERSDVAVYSLATIFFFSAVAVGGAVQGIATPAFTALIDQPRRFRRQLHRWSGLLALAGVPVAVVNTLLAWAVERYFLGSQYDGLASVVALLMVKFCLWCTYAIGGAALVGIGAIRVGTSIALITTALAIVIGYPLCQHYGIWGAAWTQVLVALVSTVLVWRVIRMETRSMVDQSISGEVG